MLANSSLWLYVNWGSSWISMLENKKCITNSCGCFPHEILTSAEGLMGYTEKGIYGLMKTRLYPQSKWYKFGTAYQILVEVSHTEF
jgi:hypothetical protein